MDGKDRLDAFWEESGNNVATRGKEIVEILVAGVFGDIAVPENAAASDVMYFGVFEMLETREFVLSIEVILVLSVQFEEGLDEIESIITFSGLFTTCSADIYTNFHGLIIALDLRYSCGNFNRN